IDRERRARPAGAGEGEGGERKEEDGVAHGGRAEHSAGPGPRQRRTDSSGAVRAHLPLCRTAARRYASHGMSSGVTTTSAEATLDALADPVIVCGTEGRLEYVNEAAGRLLGEPADALTGRRADSIVPPRLREIDGKPFFEWMATSYEEAGRPVR